LSGLALYKEDTHLEDILVDETPGDRKDSFVIDSIEKAAWAARKFIEARSRVEKRLEQNEGFKAKIELWAERANSEDLSTLDYMKSILEPYARELVKVQKKSKSLKLPEANIGFRKSPETIDITNEELAMSFCESNHPETIETKKVLLKGEVKKLLKLGKIIPGARLIPGIEQMFIKDEEEIVKR
jgi:hypothetical protein